MNTGKLQLLGFSSFLMILCSCSLDLSKLSNQPFSGQTNLAGSSRPFKSAESTQAVFDEQTLPGDGPALQAQFTGPQSLAVDSRGNVFVAESASNRIRRISPEGRVTTLPLPESKSADTQHQIFINWAGPLAVDANDNVYVANQNQLFRIAANGKVSFVAGSPTPGLTDGNGSQAQFLGLIGLACDPQGNIFVLDRSKERLDGTRIRKVTPAGEVSTYLDPLFLKTLSPQTYPGRAPSIAIDQAGDLFYGDTFISPRSEKQSYFQIARISSRQSFSVFASGQPSGEIVGLIYHYIDGMAFDQNSNIYVADNDHNIIRLVTRKGQISNAAGIDEPGFADGPSESAHFNHPQGLASDNKGNLYIADTGNNRIRMLKPNGMVSTLAGTGLPVTATAPTGAPGPDPYQTAISEGRAALQTRHFEAAAKAFQKALDLRPDEETPKSNLAASLSQLNQLDEALRLYKELEKKGSHDPDLNRSIALTYSLMGNCDMAGSYYAKDNLTTPYCPFSLSAKQHLELGDLSFLESHYLDAKEHYEKALTFQPDYLEAKFNLASVYATLGDYTQAIRLYQEVEAIKPGYPKLYESLALALSFQGQDCSKAEMYAGKAGLAKNTCPSKPGAVFIKT